MFLRHNVSNVNFDCRDILSIISIICEVEGVGNIKLVIWKDSQLLHQPLNAFAILL